MQSLFQCVFIFNSKQEISKPEKLILITFLIKLKKKTLIIFTLFFWAVEMFMSFFFFLESWVIQVSLVEMQATTWTSHLSITRLIWTMSLLKLDKKSLVGMIVHVLLYNSTGRSQFLLYHQSLNSDGRGIANWFSHSF